MSKEEFDKKGKLDELQKERMFKVLQERFDRLEDSCGPWSDDSIMEQVAAFSWTAKGIGFGTFTFYTDTKGRLHCDNETMGRDFIKRMLNKMVDDAILVHPEPKKEKGGG